MRSASEHQDRGEDVAMPQRRQLLKAGIALAAAPAIPAIAGEARADQPKAATGTGPFPTRAYGVTSATSGVAPLEIRRRALGPHDAAASGRRVAGMAVEPDRVGLEELARLADGGKLRVHVGQTFPLAEAASAHARYGRGGVSGKIVLIT